MPVTFEQEPPRPVPQRVESLAVQNIRKETTPPQAERWAIEARIAEIQGSPLWKKIWMHGALKEEINLLYQKRRKLMEAQPARPRDLEADRNYQAAA